LAASIYRAAQARDRLRFDKAPDGGDNARRMLPQRVVVLVNADFESR
jgi:hypothetical protein